MCPPIPLDTSGNFFPLHLSLRSVGMPYICNLMEHFCLDVPSHVQFIIYKTIPTFALMLPFFSPEFSLSVKYTILRLTKNLEKSYTPFSSASASSKFNSLPNYGNFISLLSPCYPCLLSWLRSLSYCYILSP